MRSTVLLALLAAAILAAGAKTPSEENVPDEVVIGILAPLSGPQASLGMDIKNSATLVAEIVNEDYNIELPLARTRGLPGLGGARIRLAFGDDAGDPEKGAMEAERLICEEGAVALLGSYSSDVTARASEVAEREGIPFLCPISVASELTQRKFQWFFRTGPSEDVYVENLFLFLDQMRSEGHEIERLAILSINNTWGNCFRDLVTKTAEQRGYQVVASISYQPDDLDMTDEVLQLKAAGNDAVLLQASYVSDAIESVRAYKLLNYTPQAIIADDEGFSDPGFVHALGNDAENLLSREIWTLDAASVNPADRDIGDLYRAISGDSLSGSSVRTIMGMLVLVTAINQTGSTDPQAIKQALLDTNVPAEALFPPWRGIRFDPVTHQNVLGGSLIAQVRDGRYWTVWPPELSLKEPLWPFPGWSS
jgi:branched-chain amino acid transport system substrate-binding protein